MLTENYWLQAQTEITAGSVSPSVLVADMSLSPAISLSEEIITQLANINNAAISNAEWGYAAAFDQYLGRKDRVQFNNLTLSDGGYLGGPAIMIGLHPNCRISFFNVGPITRQPLSPPGTLVPMGFPGVVAIADDLKNHYNYVSIPEMERAMDHIGVRINEIVQLLKDFGLTAV